MEAKVLYYAALTAGAPVQQGIQQLQAELAAVKKELETTRAALEAAKKSTTSAPPAAKQESKKEEAKDEDFDLFGDQEEDGAHEAEIDKALEHKEQELLEV